MSLSPTAFIELDKLKTPDLKVENLGEWAYQDADNELKKIAEFIKNKTSHNSNIDIDRIKFLYTRKPKKDGGRFVVGGLILRSDIDKMVNDNFDYIVIVYYQVWKDLDSKNKVIQLDKILCGIDVEEGGFDPNDLTYKKKQADSKEFTENLRYFGADDVLKSSEMIDLATQRVVEKEAENKKKTKKGTIIDANSMDES